MKSTKHPGKSKKRELLEHGPTRLPDGAPLEDVPQNEQGVVFLFSALARKKYGLRVKRVQTGYPDCIAYKCGKRIRIEFEYKSRNFRDHKHNHKLCDWIVCWEHNWPGAPERLRVVELRLAFGLGFNVWFQPVCKIEGINYADKLASGNSWKSWTVPSLATKGDLVLYHRTAESGEPKSCVRDIFRVAGPVHHVKGGDFWAEIRRVCTLKAPLRFSELQENKVVCDAGFVRGQMQHSYRASAYWPELYHLIVSRNPSLEGALKKKYGPEKVI